MSSARAVAILLLAACEHGHEREPVVVENAGRVCLHADRAISGLQRFVAGSRVVVAYEGLSECLSVSCTTDRFVTCTATAEAGGFRVTSNLSWLDISFEQGNVCDETCLVPSSTCDTGQLAAGTYEFRFGAETLSLAIPSDHAEPPCIATP